ncbi:MAG: TRAP transporter substrate-binding protein DctP [Deltaproteobacteria bacterium]|nr:TRAP transporter substrate-binding protein DctP [Deltaproteobacteria bacterium]
MKVFKIATTVFLGILLLTNPLSTVFAKSDTVTLKYGAAMGSAHPFSMADQAWIQKIEKETKGKVRIQPFWGSILIKQNEAIEQVKKGVCDIAFIVPGYAPAGFPVAKSMMGLFYGVENNDASLEIYQKVYDQFSDVSGEFADIKVLAICAAAPYQLLTGKKPVRTLADLKGLRIKCPSAFTKAFQELGVEGVLMPMSEAYVSLEKGLIDGVFAPYETLKSMRFAEVAKYVTYDIGCISAPFPKRAMNLKVWNSLPADIQKVFEANIKWWGLEELRQVNASEQAGIDLGKQHGVEFIQLPKQELKKLMDIMEKQAIEEAQKLDAKGIKGTQIFNGIRSLVQ